MATTKKPTNLSLTRSRHTMQAGWNIADSDYGDGIEFQYRWGTGGSWTSVSVGKTTKAKSFSIPVTSFYPTVQSKLLSAVQFRVRGNRKKYTKGSGSKKETINPGWSDWSEKTFNITEPINDAKVRAIQLSVESTSANSSTFSWTYGISDTSHDLFYRFEYETALVQDCATTRGDLINYTSSGTMSLIAGETQGTTGVDSAHQPIVITEDSSILHDGHSYTRWFRVRAVGAGGYSAWTYVSRIFAEAQAPTNAEVESRTNANGTTTVDMSFDSFSNLLTPVKEIKTQYTLVTPAAGLTCPSGASWTDGETITYSANLNRSIFKTDAQAGLDQCLFVRAIAYNMDSDPSYGDIILAGVGKMKPPTMQAPVTDAATHKATITATNTSDVPDAQIAVVYQGSNNPDKSFIVGIIPDGYTSVTVQAPNWDDESAVAFGTFAFVGTPTKQTRDDGVDVYTITSPNPNFEMRSTTVWLGGTVPKAPSNVSVKVKDGAEGIVTVNWDWTWEDATGAELAWADHEDAWESTDEPDTFSVSNLHAAHWNIAGLDAGKTWYIRIRFFQETESSTVYSPWSELTSSSIIDLSSAPDEPAIELSAGVVPYDGAFTVNWGYVSTDGTPQARASVAEVTTTTSNNTTTTTYTEIGHTLTAQHIDFSVEELGWQNNTTHYIALKVWSESGNESEWSQIMPVVIAPRLTCSITSTSLETVTVPADDDEETTRQVLSLTEMPLSVSVSGAGASGITTVAVERAESFFAERPDEVNFNGYEGETVALQSMTGAGTFTFALDDMIGELDDNASYRIVATVEDGNGQRATAEQRFEVHWEHQAVTPTAEIDFSAEYGIAYIKPMANDVLETDTADIYRLSADKPDLIIKGAEFGEWYVDPYPALGEFAGYRIVCVTANGDYITADNHFAWIDYRADEDAIPAENVLIDFDGERISLRYNIDISDSWDKDFEETQYLGGAVQGDWNPAISRSGSVSSAAITLTDQDTILAMRRLANYAGICHMRMPNGSSFSCDIQVSEKSSHKSGGKVVDYDLKIVRVEPESLDGILLSEYQIDDGGEPVPPTPTDTHYHGDYTVTPSDEDIVLETNGLIMDDDVTVLAVAEGTAGTPTATKSAVSNNAVTVTPSVTNTAGYISGGTLTGTAVSVAASELVSGTYSVTSSGTKDVTNYASASVPAGTEGTPTATKGTVSNHAVTITPSVINVEGYISGGTHSGTAVSVSASELVSGSQTFTENASNVDVTNLASITVAVPTSPDGDNLSYGTAS